jgi:cell division transport system permease protein
MGVLLEMYKGETTEMKLRTVNYCFKQGIINLYKNRLMTMASIGTISACLFIIGIFYIVVANVEYTLQEAESNLGISVFLTKDITDEEKQDIETKIIQRNEVKSVTYISPQQAWEDFKLMYKDRQELLLGYDENNHPLMNSDNFQVLIKDIDKQDSLVKYVETLKGVRYIRQEKDVTEVIKSFNSFINYLSIVLIVILIVISVFLISNTVRLGISVRKNEINIMKYIGAKDYFIKFPFIIEGIVIGAIGAIIPLVIINFSYKYVIQKITEKFGVIEHFLYFMEAGQVFKVLVPLCVAIGIGIGVTGSRLTIRKHLKV